MTARPRTMAAHPRRPPGPVAVTATLVAALAAGAVPVFLTGALQGRIAEDLQTGMAGIGISVAAFFVAAGTSSIPAGRVVDRIGAPVALRFGMVLAGGASLGIAALADSHRQFTLMLMLAGVGMALVDTAGSRALSRAVPRRRQAVAFGTKEASGPLASLIAGLTLPVIGAELGWRPAFTVAAVLAIITGVLISSRLDDARGGEVGSTDNDVHSPAADVVARRDAQYIPSDPQTRGGPASNPNGSSTVRLLVLLALSAASAGAVASSVATFLVPTGERAGLSASTAGLILAIASLTSVTSRVVSGWAVDRRAGSELLAVSVMVGVGAIGVAGLAVVSGPMAGAPAARVVLVLAGMLALGGGWGWTGLLFLAGIRVEPNRPAMSGGVVLAGLGLGGSAGPAVFGFLAETFSFALGWAVAAICMAIAAVIAQLLRWRMRSGRAESGAALDAPAAGTGSPPSGEVPPARRGMQT